MVRTISVKPTGDALLMQLILEVAPESSVLVCSLSPSCVCLLLHAGLLPQQEAYREHG
jgi:hypothetical protein